MKTDGEHRSDAISSALPPVAPNTPSPASVSSALLIPRRTPLQLTATLGLSMELGSFTAGLMISVHPKHTHPTLTITESVRDLFACVFFVTMGLHIYPSFLLSQVHAIALDRIAPPP